MLPDRSPLARAGLSRDDIRALTRTSAWRGALAVAWIWLGIAACLAAVRYEPRLAPLAVIVLGGRQLALAVAMHDAAHGTLFGVRWLDRHVADWLCARPVWSDVARYRKHHLAHHAHTGTDRDPDLGLALVEPMTRGSLARKIARDLTGIAGVRRVVALLAIDAELLEFDVGGGVRRAPRRSAARHVAALARHLAPTVVTNALLAVVAGWAYLAWVAAYLTTFSLALRVRSLAEHACLARTGDVLANTRTTRAGWLARATVAPLHVNYHLEHHLLPTVPWYRLPALARRIAGVAPPPTPGYRAVLRTVAR